MTETDYEGLEIIQTDGKNKHIAIIEANQVPLLRQGMELYWFRHSLLRPLSVSELEKYLEGLRESSLFD